MTNPSFMDEPPDIPLPDYPHCKFCGSEVDLAERILTNVTWRDKELNGRYPLCEPCRVSRDDREEDGR